MTEKVGGTVSRTDVATPFFLSLFSFYLIFLVLETTRFIVLFCFSSNFSASLFLKSFTVTAVNYHNIPNVLFQIV